MRVVMLASAFVIFSGGLAIADSDENGWHGARWGTKESDLRVLFRDGFNTTSDGKAVLRVPITIGDNNFTCDLELGDSGTDSNNLKLRRVECESILPVTDLFLADVDRGLTAKFGVPKSANPRNPLYQYGIELGPARFGDKRNKIYTGPYTVVETQISKNQELTLKYAPIHTVGDGDL